MVDVKALQAKLDAAVPGGVTELNADEMAYMVAGQMQPRRPEPDLSAARAKAQAFFDAWHMPHPVGARNAMALALDELFTEIVAAARAPRQPEDDGA